MKKIAALLVALMLCGAAFADAPVEEFAVNGEFGKVLSVTVDEKAGALIEAEGYWGYHMDQDPSMTVDAVIEPDGTIARVLVAGSKDQTPGFDAMITQEYLDAAYIGKIADPNLDVDAATGATATSQAVLYAVRTACAYARNALGFTADTNSAENAELNEVYAADYTALDTSAFEADPKKLGTVLYAAEGVAADGTKVLAVKVKSMTKPDQSGSARTGWTAATPNPFTMIVVIGVEEARVLAWKMVQAGYKDSSRFTVPDELIDAYKTVEITDAAVFDEFYEGSVMTMSFETETTDDGPMITGTSIVYTGKTVQGTFSSQFIRSCFRTAAKLFIENYR